MFVGRVSEHVPRVRPGVATLGHVGGVCVVVGTDGGIEEKMRCGGVVWGVQLLEETGGAACVGNKAAAEVGERRCDDVRDSVVDEGVVVAVVGGRGLVVGRRRSHRLQVLVVQVAVAPHLDEAWQGGSTEKVLKFNFNSSKATKQSKMYLKFYLRNWIREN